MITCKECVHYTPKNYNFGSCKRWNVESHYNDDILKMPTNEVCVEFDEEWGMVCGKDFGCVLGERRNV